MIFEKYILTSDYAHPSSGDNKIIIFKDSEIDGYRTEAPNGTPSILYKHPIDVRYLLMYIPLEFVETAEKRRIDKTSDPIFEAINKDNISKEPLTNTVPPKDKSVKSTGILDMLLEKLSETEKQRIKKDIDYIKHINEIIERIKRKDSYIEDYPEEIQKILKSILESNEE